MPENDSHAVWGSVPESINHLREKRMISTVVKARFFPDNNGNIDCSEVLMLFSRGNTALKRAAVMICITTAFSFFAAAYAQEIPTDPAQPPADDSQKQDKTPTRNINIDMQLAYGQYNNIYSTINLSQETDKFVYLLNSNFKRSNDFGYKTETYANTSYQENKIGFTGNLSMTDGWKTLFEGSVDGGSYGMFENPTYIREEKERYSLLAKNTIRSSSVEWFTTVNYSGYTHRLSGRNSDDNEKSTLNKLSGELGGEYIMSSANRIRWDMTSSWYRYNEEASPDDVSVRANMYDDFKITSALGVSVGVNTAWDKDGGSLGFNVNRDSSKKIPVAPTGGIFFSGDNSFSASVFYRYDLEPFRPENLFFEQKYVLPEYTFNPSRSHIVEGKADVKAGDYLTIKFSSVYKNSDCFYNYSANANNVLIAHEIKASSLSFKGDISLKVLNSGLVLESGYENFKPWADEKVTYRPLYIVNGTVKYNGDVWKLEWSNKFISKTFVDPESSKTLSHAVIGVLGAQYQMVRGLYSYLRVENLYNNRYSLREGYPEPGIVFLGGVRILM